MKCNPEKSLEARIVNKIVHRLDEQRLLWELLTVVVLHDEFGFGQERLERWGKAMQKLYNDFTQESRSTDTPHRKGAPKMTNMDTATIKILRNLKSYGVDYHTILGVDDLKIDGESLDDIINKMEEVSR